MRYFLLNLAIILSISIVLIILVCITSQRNKNRKTKHVVSYFLPVILALICLIWSVNLTVPRLRDITGVINDNYYTNTGKVEFVSVFKNYFIMDGVTYYMNPRRNDIEEGDIIRVRHTRYSRYTVQVIKIDQAE